MPRRPAFPVVHTRPQTGRCTGNIAVPAQCHPSILWQITRCMAVTCDNGSGHGAPVAQTIMPIMEIENWNLYSSGLEEAGGKIHRSREQENIEMLL